MAMDLITKNSVFETAPTKAKALQKVKNYERRLGNRVVKVKSWDGGGQTISGKRFPNGQHKNYWFNIQVKPIKGFWGK